MAIAQVLGKQSLEELIFGIERDSKKAIDKGISQSTAHTLTPSGAIYELATLNTSSAQDAATKKMEALMDSMNEKMQEFLKSKGLPQDAFHDFERHKKKSDYDVLVKGEIETAKELAKQFVQSLIDDDMIKDRHACEGVDTSNDAIAMYGRKGTIGVAEEREQFLNAQVDQWTGVDHFEKRFTDFLANTKGLGKNNEKLQEFFAMLAKSRNKVIIATENLETALMKQEPMVEDPELADALEQWFKMARTASPKALNRAEQIMIFKNIIGHKTYDMGAKYGQWLTKIEIPADDVQLKQYMKNRFAVYNELNFIDDDKTYDLLANDDMLKEPLEKRLMTYLKMGTFSLMQRAKKELDEGKREYEAIVKKHLGKDKCFSGPDAKEKTKKMWKEVISTWVKKRWTRTDGADKANQVISLMEKDRSFTENICRIYQRHEESQTLNALYKSKDILEDMDPLLTQMSATSSRHYISRTRLGGSILKDANKPSDPKYKELLQAMDKHALSAGYVIKPGTDGEIMLRAFEERTQHITYVPDHPKLKPLTQSSLIDPNTNLPARY